MKPFTVYAGGLATTALGTDFTINTRDPGQQGVSIKLHAGRVVITSAGTPGLQWKKDVYLLPGQQLKFDSAKMIAAIGLIRNDIVLTKKIKNIEKKITIPEDNGLSFENTPLPEVMARLSGYYHEFISFDSSSIGEMNFTGNIIKKDSLQIVLKVIAQMNHLEMTHENGQYKIGKPKD